ncbi:hypothetical protein DK842_21750 [Chromobacterium phragmitis]|uniref:hypothetical protein n=1 Tax=Chromobacterium phragmitis TaxID=2202141 RepID=UPI000DECC97D|nr:hypothetical protein [Chromobacterium phragmitis]AXE32306.1 hypothetical protein DK842_21750 [Chromobacterium phragmitis]
MKPGNADADGPSPRNLLQYWLRKLSGSRLSVHDKLHYEPMQEELLLNLMVIVCILLLAVYAYLRQ